MAGLTGWTDIAPASATQSGGIFHFSVTLGQGDHTIRLYSSDTCLGIADFTVLPGEPRSIFLILSPGILIDDRDFRLVGTLPSPDFVVTAVAPDGTESLAEVDGSAYYFENLKKLTYKLRIWVLARQYVEIPVALNSPFTQRDITAVDLREPLHDGP